LKNYVCIPVDFSPRLCQSISLNDLPDNWRTDPIPESVQAIGDQWVQNKESAILKVPSVIIPVEYNYVINPSHPDFTKLDVHSPQQFILDIRLLNKIGRREKGGGFTWNKESLHE
jgi:RES domain-containing protein